MGFGVDERFKRLSDDEAMRLDPAAVLGAGGEARTLVAMAEAAAGWEPPGPKAAAFFLSDADIIGIRGPVGSGKTRTTVMSRLRRASAMPQSSIDGMRHYKLVTVRETYRQLWQTTIPSWHEVFPKSMGVWSGGRGDPVTHEITLEDAYGLIRITAEFLAFGDSIIESMRGIQATDLWLSEADTLPVEVLTTGIGRIDRYPHKGHFSEMAPDQRGYGQIACDFNAPEDDENWTVAVFEEEEKRAQLFGASEDGLKPPKIEFFKQPGGMEPDAENKQNLGLSYYPRQVYAMTAAGRSDQIERLVHNRRAPKIAGDLVFKKQFKPGLHLSPQPLRPWPGVPLRIGLDQGFFGAAVIGQFKPPYHWRILAELAPTTRTMATEFGRDLRELLETRFPGLDVESSWGDMAGEAGSAIADDSENWNAHVSREAGIWVQPQTTGGNRIGARLEAVRAALDFLYSGSPGLLVDPSCKAIINGFLARYVWVDKINGTGDKRKVPDKRFIEANAHDALQYLLLSEALPTGETPAVAAQRAAAQIARAAPAPLNPIQTDYNPLSWGAGS